MYSVITGATSVSQFRFLEQRKAAKKRKKHDWAKKGGKIAPIFVPVTPGSQLLKEMRKVAEREGKEGIVFNIVEGGGGILKRELQRSNPTVDPGCTKVACPCCVGKRGEGGQCHRANVNYEVVCELCPKESHTKYIGETSRNLFTRMGEHNRAEHYEGSFMRKHMEEKHEGEESKFRARVTHSNKDCLTRQIREGVLIKHNRNALNTKSEWHQPSLYRVENQVVRE